LVEDRNGVVQFLTPFQKAVSDRKIIVIPCLELVEEIIVVAKDDHLISK